MNKKLGIVILIIFLIIISIGVFKFNDFSNVDKTVKVGSADFTLPKGYAVGSPNQYGAVNITDGNHSIYLAEYNTTDVNKLIRDYESFVKNQNQSMKIVNLTIDNVLIKKTDNADNPLNVHYWVVKNNKTYDIYKWDDNPNMDSLVIDLVKSLGNAN